MEDGNYRGRFDRVISETLAQAVRIIADDPALFIGFPGNLEPCPAAPYSDENLAEVPLETALRSRLLLRIREKPELLTETNGGCALRANRAMVERIAGPNMGREQKIVGKGGENW
jgi:hypothetical protein